MKEFHKLISELEIGFSAVLIFILAIVSGRITFLVSEGNLEISLFTGVLAFLVIFMWFISEDYFGKKKHASIVHSKIFQQLCCDMNFKIESHNKDIYWGLKGTYKRYFFRIFYNWNTSVTNSNFSREITIMLHFAPPTNQMGSMDTLLLDTLNDKYREKGYFIPHNTNVKIKLSHIQINRGYNIFTSQKDIAKQIERAVQIANTENLEPIEEKLINELIAKDTFSHGPDIETFNNNYS